ncbi:MAG: branched-chain amino acid ABC transporter permease [Desulfobacteraceae bacterium]|nr:branched-chain amino acid ABC transporter permease [Desulfobacteraceae bacterium]
MQILLNGIISGLTISLLAVAFSLVYTPTRVFHIAMGGVYALVPYVAWACLRADLPWFLAAFMGIMAGLGLSLACEVCNHAPLERRKASLGAHLIASLGVYIVVVQVIALIWGNDIKLLRQGLDSVEEIGGVIATHSQLWAGFVSLIILLFFFLWLKVSNLGLRFRALAENPEEFVLRGYNVNHIRLLTFGLSGVFCSTSALLVSYDIGFDPHGGLQAVLLAIVAVIIGGRGSFFGVVIGGLLLGVVRAEVVWFFSARWQEAVTFIFLVIFLFLRPYGILGHKRRLEAEL